MNHVSEQLFKKRLLMGLPHLIDHSDQNLIIQEVIKNGTDRDVWYSYPIRGSQKYTDRQNYDNRLDLSFPWEYLDTPITELVKKLIFPLSHFYKPTRIKIFVQKPHQILREHCDKLDYKNNELFRNFFKTEQFHHFFPEPLHLEQECLTIKIPITEVPDDNGKGFVRVKGSKYYLKPKNQYYLLNESHVRHGADACTHHRGVIFLDGKIYINELKNTALSEIQLVREENV